MAAKSVKSTWPLSSVSKPTTSKPKSDLGDILNKRKLGKTDDNIFDKKPAKKANSRSLEEDEGFVFQRKNNTSSKTIKAENTIDSKPSNQSTISTNPTTDTTKNKMAAFRRRKSSIGGLKGAVGTRRTSSFGIGLAQKLPPASVKPCDYHKHLMPDLPGPVKMRQLMVWAVQKAIHGNRKKAVLEPVSEVLLQGLLKNELETSWYTRPACTGQSGDKKPSKHPQNIELIDTITQVRQYLSILKNELEMWKRIDEQKIIPINDDDDVNEQSNHDLLIQELRGNSIKQDLEQSADWIKRMPVAMDRFDLSLRLSSTFTLKSSDFCEDIFRQIFARFFSDQATPNIDPLVVLKALSSKLPGVVKNNRAKTAIIN